jgi:hypothetical protein
MTSYFWLIFRVQLRGPSGLDQSTFANVDLSPRCSKSGGLRLISRKLLAIYRKKIKFLNDSNSSALMSISPTIYALLFCTKGLRTAFCTYILSLYFIGARILAQKLLLKCWWNSPHNWGQFHQHLTGTFLYKTKMSTFKVCGFWRNEATVKWN